jgi:branched-chain amino acid transport system substrate-binding protein
VKTTGASRLRRLLATAVALAMCLVLRPVLAADVVEIPVILSLTGTSAFQGRGIQQSLQALEDLVNRNGGVAGRPVQFQFQDDQTNPQVGVQLMNAVIAQKSPVVMGSVTVGVCQAMAALIKDGPVQYCLSPGVHPEEGSYLFSALTSTTDAIDMSLHYFHDQNIKRIAVITATDATGQDADRSIDATVASMRGDVTIVDREHFNPTDIAVSAQMAKIKAANPQLLVAWATGTPAATIFRAFKEAALDIPVLTTYGNSVYALIAQQWASFLPVNLYLPAQPNLAPQQVTDRATKAALAAHFAQLTKFSIQPDVINGGPWDAALLIIDALRKLGPRATAAQVRDYLLNTRGWTGIFGRYDFKAVPQRGLSRNAMFIARWDATKQVWVAVSRAGGAPLK